MVSFGGSLVRTRVTLSSDIVREVHTKSGRWDEKSLRASSAEGSQQMAFFQPVSPVVHSTGRGSHRGLRPTGQATLEPQEGIPSEIEVAAFIAGEKAAGQALRVSQNRVRQLELKEEERIRLWYVPYPDPQDNENPQYTEQDLERTGQWATQQREFLDDRNS